MNPVTLFGNVYQDLSRSYNLPLPVSICVRGLSMVHWIWWLRRKRELVKPENIIPAALGTFLDGTLKLTPNSIEKAFRGVAKLILIATRIDESVQRLQSLAQAFIDLKEAASARFSLFIEPQWIKSADSIFLSVHTFNQWKMHEKVLIAYIKRIYYCFLSIFSKTFKLSMQLWDTYHAFVFSHDAIPEVFVNGMYWFRKIRNDKDYIQAKLEQYRPLIQNIFHATHSSSSVDHLIDRTQDLLNLTANGIDRIDNFNHFVVEKVIHQGKKIASLIKSKLLGQEFIEKQPNTPFVLKKLPF